MKVAFFGDSLTVGEGNKNISFADLAFRDATKVKLCESGSTVGEYSIYPVDGNSLLSKLFQNVRDVKNSDLIVLEYGVNDASAVLAENATYRKVILSVVKALDFIKQNSNAKVMWLRPFLPFSFYSNNQVSYVFNEYCKGIFTSHREDWAYIFNNFYNDICKIVPVVAGIDSESVLQSVIIKDKIHINMNGHKILAKKLEKAYEGIFCSNNG